MTFIIDKQYLTVNKYSRPKRYLKSVNAIVIHWVANPNSSAQGNRNYFERRKSGSSGYGSAHFIVNLDGKIVQCLPEEEMAYHIGSHVYTDRALKEISSYPNNASIGIECTHVDWDGNMTDDTYQSTVELTAHLLKKYGLTEKNIWLHYETNGWKDCHRLFVSSDAKYKNFKQDVVKAMNGETIEVDESHKDTGNLEYVSVLSHGDRGYKVRKLQEALNKLGFNSGVVDGIYGDNTDDAVESFQREYGLIIDGAAGRQTISKINELLSQGGNSDMTIMLELKDEWMWDMLIDKLEKCKSEGQFNSDQWLEKAKAKNMTLSELAWLHFIIDDKM